MKADRLIALLTGLTLAVSVAGCGSESAQRQPARRVTVNAAATISVSRTPSVPSPRTPQVALTAWHGPIEELFVHPLVINPKRAFTNDQLGIGFQDNFVTVWEFQRILDQLWAKGWTLVDVHSAANGTVRVPVGRRPLVLSEDDVNYYRYFDGRGLAARLVLAGGRVMAQLPTGQLSDKDVIPLVDAEVARHPEFSADGAKGVIAVTGYEGLLGEHHPEQPSARARLIAIANWLKADGWTFASHTWGHIDLSTNSLASIAWDTRQYKAEADAILGPVDVVIYPFGARPDAAAIHQLVAAGYKIQLDIDIVARTSHLYGATVMSRRHVDGYAFQVPQQQAQFYNVSTVRDPTRPG